MAPVVVSMGMPATGLGVLSGRTERMSPVDPSRPWRSPRRASGSTAGTLRLSTVPGGWATSAGTMAVASWTGVSHGMGSRPQAMLTASPRMPNWAPVSVAPTVPECKADRPALTP